MQKQRILLITSVIMSIFVIGIITISFVSEYNYSNNTINNSKKIEEKVLDDLNDSLDIIELEEIPEEEPEIEPIETKEEEIKEVTSKKETTKPKSNNNKKQESKKNETKKEETTNKVDQTENKKEEPIEQTQNPKEEVVTQPKQEEPVVQQPKEEPKDEEFEKFKKKYKYSNSDVCYNASNDLSRQLAIDGIDYKNTGCISGSMNGYVGWALYIHHIDGTFEYR